MWREEGWDMALVNLLKVFFYAQIATQFQSKFTIRKVPSFKKELFQIRLHKTELVPSHFRRLRSEASGAPSRHRQDSRIPTDRHRRMQVFQTVRRTAPQG